MATSFAKWLAQFEKDDTPRGDLARDVADDMYAPKHSSSRKVWKSHIWLQSQSQSEDVMDVLEDAFDDYWDTAA